MTLTRALPPARSVFAAVLLRGVFALVVSAGVGAVIWAGSATLDSWQEHDVQGRLPTELEGAVAQRFANAQVAAADVGVELVLTSGWRSFQTQQRLFDEAIGRHGSAELAMAWVLPPNRSAHVWGRAVDVGPADAAAWLEREGFRFGLCRVYANDPTHFEPLVKPGSPCPLLLRPSK